jgi:hypothetical protein
LERNNERDLKKSGKGKKNGEEGVWEFKSVKKRDKNWEILFIGFRGILNKS